MLFGKKANTKHYCYCNYGKSGIMINCGKCNNWFHDECLGLTEAEISNIIDFYCSECLNNDHSLSTTYKIFLPQITKDTFCLCNGCESGLMIECNKCKHWFHQECVGLSEWK